MGLVSYLKTRKKSRQDRSEGWKWDRCDCLNRRRQPNQYIDIDGILKCDNCRVYIAGGY